ncbi:MAG: UbiA-like protein EboC [Bernardetiaceae bacterium]|jgi:4-hydroxybenzoate polyprenyltransferase|nr:UbiA-like protein EboC [Bernardetiaceae bacterium]
MNTPKWMGLARLTRPANLITAVADVLAGAAVSLGLLQQAQQAWPATAQVPFPWGQLGLLCLATLGLYGGGVVLNDVCDADLDAQERPDRPIPSGLVSRAEATTFGVGLLAAGIVLAALAAGLSGLVAGAVALLAVVYDAYGKHHPWLGPLNMGLCRGGNLLLGMSVLPMGPLLGQLAWLGLLPVAYIAAITLISRGEVHGGSRTHLQIGGALYGLVGLGLLLAGQVAERVNWASALGLPGEMLGPPLPKLHFLMMLPLLALLAYLVFTPWWRAWQAPAPKNVMLAVKAGVLSLIVLDATLAAHFAGLGWGLLILALLPLSRWLAKAFAVT